MAHDHESNPLARHGGLSYLEIPTVDPARSGAFYKEVFGWQVDQRTPTDFRFSDDNGLLIGRFAPTNAPAREPGFLPFIYVDSVDGAISRASASGGELATPPYAEGDLRVAKVRDPAGNLVGLWQFAPR